MRSFIDAKAMAKSLRSSLQARNIAISHSDSLELVAQSFGCENWNELAAHIKADASPDSAVTLDSPIPIVRIFDVQKAKDFYLTHLGFTLEWEHRFGEDFPVYMQVSRSGATLHLSEHNGDGTPGSIVYINVQGLSQLQRELAGKGQRATIEDGPGARNTLQLWDPFGNRVRLAERKPGSPDNREDGYTRPA